MPRPIAFDLSRLFFGVVGRTPRGIDRIDTGLIHHLFGDPERGDLGVLPSLTGMGTVSPQAGLAMLKVVETHWRETAPGGGDDRAAALRAWLLRPLGRAADDAASRPIASAPDAGVGPGLLRRYGAMAWPARWAGLARAVDRVPPGAIYLNTGQVLLGWPPFFRWLRRRPDVRPVFMIHDLIPVRHPEYAGPFLAAVHRRALTTASRHAAALLASSRAVADEVGAALRALGAAPVPIHVTPLPVSASLLGGSRPEGLHGAPPYFVSVGVLDQRKNHRLLLALWRDLLRHGPGPVPRLVIAGGRGMRTAWIHDMVARSPGLADAVTIVSGLPSPALREVIGGARALLMPSFAEGFGLPLVEAEALGVPVVASDIPAHREVAGRNATLLHPLDGEGWRRAILALAAAGRAGGPGPEPGGALAPQDWSRYLADVLPFLDSL